jgi:hypothetical protein
MQRFGECMRRLIITFRRPILAYAGPVFAGVQLVEVMSIHPYQHGVPAFPFPSSSPRNREHEPDLVVSIIWDAIVVGYGWLFESLAGEFCEVNSFLLSWRGVGSGVS